MLTNWNFQDEGANSTTQQINRQKSARNLEILQFDPSEPRAVFVDPKRNNRQTATLTRCDCNDFNLAGSSPRKTFKPCMHIYRLAIELGLIEARYLDHRARFALADTLSREETQRLQRLAPDPKQWGCWAPEIHASGVQRNRQYRAYLIYHDEHGAVRETAGGWRTHDYSATLDHCECPDFLNRKLPCKHIYAAALASKISVPFTDADYEAARNRGLEIVFEFPTSA
ncbi:MAG: SWIM zinc finger family protein [Bryobacteraceae bacterium]|jgi:predicted nucleic acid-binding Zn finger protein